MFLNVMTIISVMEILVISYNTQTDSEGVMNPDFSNKMGNFRAMYIPDLSLV